MPAEKNTGKIFFQGGSQAVRIPHQWRFPSSVAELEFREVEGGALEIRPVLQPEAQALDLQRLAQVAACIFEWQALPQERQGNAAEPTIQRLLRLLTR